MLRLVLFHFSASLPAPSLSIAPKWLRKCLKRKALALFLQVELVVLNKSLSVLSTKIYLVGWVGNYLSHMNLGWAVAFFCVLDHESSPFGAVIMFPLMTLLI